MNATRFSNSLFIEPSSKTGAAMLVRIYPEVGIGATIELVEPCILIGRDSTSSLSIEDDSVSRRHAMIEQVGTSHVVTDLGSTNGTYVNEEQLSHAVVLRAGDRVRFGNQTFKYLTSDGIESQYHEVVYKLMTTDGLTQAFNKRYLLDNLERSIQQTDRTKAAFCVMLMDLDRFKSVNDTHGHLAGDAVLVEFANRIRSVLRGGELLARYGGEEFAVLCSPACLEEAVSCAERIRFVTSETPVVFQSVSIPITVSIGVTSYFPDSGAKSLELLAEADRLLYVAKTSGRNQVQFVGK